MCREARGLRCHSPAKGLQLLPQGLLRPQGDPWSPTPLEQFFQRGFRKCACHPRERFFKPYKHFTDVKQKAKGSNAERELVHLFWERGWAAVRVAGSGSTRHPAPDLLVGNGVRRLAIECKSSAEGRRYLTRQQVLELVQFAEAFGAEAWIGMRFDRMRWHFLPVSELKEAPGSFSVDVTEARHRGLLIDEIIR